MSTRRKRRSALPLFAVLALIAAGAWYGLGPGQWFAGETEEAVTGAAVRRGPLRISILQRGELEAKNQVQLRSEIEGRTTILSLIAEGTMVQPGDLLAELDASEQIDQRVGQEIAVENAISDLTKAEQNLEIQKSQNASDIARAEQDLDFARKDLTKYQDGDWPQQLQEAEEAIILAQEELAQAKDRLEWSRRLEKDGFLTRTKLEEDELSYESSKIRLEQTKRRKTLLIDYDNPREMARLTAAVEEAERELERVKLQAEARLVDYDAAVRTSKSKRKLEEEKLAKLERQIAAAKIYAPEAGMVVYGREDGGRGRGDDPIQEGTEVRQRQEIITIPRSGEMMVKASLHESVLKKVDVGQRCVVTIDALPGQEFIGTVDFVAHLADKGSWWANPDQRLYRTEISLDRSHAEMRPGMSCGVEIIVADLDDTLYVPVQSVVYHRGETICFVDDSGSIEERQVEVGLSSEKWAQVLGGVEEGEIVLLAPPPGFIPEGAEPSEAPEVQGEAGGPDGGQQSGMGFSPTASRGGERGEGRPERDGRDRDLNQEGEAAGFDPSTFDWSTFDPENPPEGLDMEKLREQFRQRGGDGGGFGGPPAGGGSPPAQDQAGSQ